MKRKIEDLKLLDIEIRGIVAERGHKMTHDVVNEYKLYLDKSGCPKKVTILEEVTYDTVAVYYIENFYLKEGEEWSSFIPKSISYLDIICYRRAVSLNNLLKDDIELGS
jgi:hypothetical protein